MSDVTRTTTDIYTPDHDSDMPLPNGDDLAIGSDEHTPHWRRAFGQRTACLFETELQVLTVLLHVQAYLMMPILTRSRER